MMSCTHSKWYYIRKAQKKEMREHPWVTRKQAYRIALDHAKKKR